LCITPYLLRSCLWTLASATAPTDRAWERKMCSVFAAGPTATMNWVWLDRCTRGSFSRQTSMTPLCKCDPRYDFGPQIRSALATFKGTVSRDFRLSVCFINQTHIGPWLTGQNLFSYGFVFAEVFNAKVANIGFRWVNDPAETEFFFRIPKLFFCLKYRYSMRILTYETFCWIFSLKKAVDP
jgi:hypothetical protein